MSNNAVDHLVIVHGLLYYEHW